MKGMVTTMSSISLLGTANSTLTASYYLGKYYTGNRTLKSSSGRKDVANSILLSNDSSAFKKFLRDIKKTDLSTLKDDDKATNHKNKVSAFVSVYNNFVSSCGKSTDHYNTSRITNIKKLTKSQKQALEDIGITINKDSTLELNAEKLKKADIYNVSSIFSKDSDYIKGLTKYTSRINITV